MEGSLVERVGSASPFPQLTSAHLLLPSDAYELARSRAWVEVDRQALHHNLKVLRQQLRADTQIWAVVKANAYGHGVQIIAPTAIAAGAEGVCVATLAEGMELRQQGLTASILVLGALNTELEVKLALSSQLDLTLTDAGQIPLLQAVGSRHPTPIPLHLNVDTGMTRLGVPWQQAAAIWQDLLQIPEFACRSLYSHLATADEVDTQVVELQEQRFQTVIEDLQARGLGIPVLHVDNSAGALASRRRHHQRVRLGLVLYGLAPASHLHLEDLRPLLQIKARITHLQWVEAGTGVSYGHRYLTPQAARIATVAIGYADGIPRRLSGWLQGYLHGQKIQQVGTITMDQCMWDVTPLKQVAVGDVVELFGADLTPQHWADHLGTIAYEILCGFSARLPRLEKASG
ncbi:MAG: alanine racemase [Cyanobacteriota bacterium]|nr:alanine racemase [Cyanobacteriota bacterium]